MFVDNLRCRHRDLTFTSRRLTTAVAVGDQQKATAPVTPRSSAITPIRVTSRRSRDVPSSPPDTAGNFHQRLVGFVSTISGDEDLRTATPRARSPEPMVSNVLIFSSAHVG
jgi:hypothetical protein